MSTDDERTLIGSGAMGDVYVAYCEILERVVVAKEFRTDCVELDEWVDRFEFEHLCAARVDHPNVIRSLRSEARLTPPRIILERVQGMTMAERIGISRPRYPVVVRWFRQILSGLEAIHRAGIVHRDIKPSNIMIDDDDRAVIIDFGLAHCDEIQMRHDPLINNDEPCVGTPAYMAPEQTRETIVDARADLWAAGASMFEALTESRLSRASTPTNPCDPVAIEQHRAQTVSRLRFPALSPT